MFNSLLNDYLRIFNELSATNSYDYEKLDK
jgi:hypothetical protein